MLKTVAGALVGILLTIGFVYVVGSKDVEAHKDRCLAAAVRTYPTLGGADMVVGNLKDCHGLSDTALASVRTDLQNFGVEAARRVAEGK